MTIRDAAEGDRAAVEPLWTECLRLHGAAFDAGAFGRTWSRAMGGEGFGLRIGLAGEGIAGFALHSWQPNSWTGAEEGVLDTIFVAGANRGAGIGRALIEDLLALGRARGWRSVHWHVEAGSRPARALYARFAAPDGYLRYRVTP